jgi:hypothetical protein
MNLMRGHEDNKPLEGLDQLQQSSECEQKTQESLRADTQSSRVDEPQSIRIHKCEGTIRRQQSAQIELTPNDECMFGSSQTPAESSVTIILEFSGGTGGGPGFRGASPQTQFIPSCCCSTPSCCRPGQQTTISTNQSSNQMACEHHSETGSEGMETPILSRSASDNPPTKEQDHPSESLRTHKKEALGLSNDNILLNSNPCLSEITSSLPSVEKMASEHAVSNNGRYLQLKVRFHDSYSFKCCLEHKFELTGKEIQTGKWCSKCAEVFKFVSKFAKKKDGKILDAQIKPKMNCRCVRGHVFSIRPSE